MGMFKQAAKPAAKKAAPAAKAAPKKMVPAKKAAARRDDDDDEEIDDDMDGGVTTGWGGAEKMAAEYSGFAARLSLKDGETVVIRFLDDAPYANVATHWISRRSEDKKSTTRRSYICLGKGKCPLCGIGDTPRVNYCFNVAKLTDEEPIVLSWEVGIKLYRKAEKKAKDPKTSPLTKLYYELSRTGSTKDNTDYELKEVRRASDLEEDWPDLNIPSEKEIKALVGYSKADVDKQKTSLKDLREVAAEISGGEADDEDDD